MPVATCKTARRPLSQLSTEQLCLAEISFSYGSVPETDILKAIRTELNSRQPAFDDWRWEAVPTDGFELRFGERGWRVMPPYNAPSVIA